MVWVFIFAGEEVLEYLSQIFIKSCPLVVKNSEIIVNSKSIRKIIDVNPNEFKNFLENLFSNNKTTVFFSKRLYDLEKSENTIIAHFDKWRIRKIVILELDLPNFLKELVKGKRPIEQSIIARTKDVKFIKNGLVQFDFEIIKSELNPEDVSKQFFRIIRDVYHAHTHHKHQYDVLLEPVKAYDEDSAKRKILEKYLAKIVDYHKEIKKRVDLPLHHYFSLLKYNDSEDLIMQALGEMTYAESFSELFLDSYKGRFKKAKDSIIILHDRIKAKMMLVPLLLALPPAILAMVNYGLKPFLLDTGFPISRINEITFVFTIFLLAPPYIILLSTSFIYLIQPVFEFLQKFKK